MKLRNMRDSINTGSKYKYIGKINANTRFEFDVDVSSNISIDTSLFVVQDFNTRYKMIEDRFAGLPPIIKDTVTTMHLSYGPYRQEFIKNKLHNISGMIFHGPPGTGKTKVAKSIAEFFGANDKRLIVVKGPELLNKYVGESEKNVRNLFEPARTAYKLYGDNADIYIIIIDEIDSIIPSRSSGTNSYVRNSVTNQFLSEIDGVMNLPNILVIGTTNKLELVDTALTRSGRLSLVVKFELPDLATRENIFKIYLKHIIDTNKEIESMVSNLAKMTDKCTGADIEAIVNLALTNNFKESVMAISNNTDVTTGSAINISPLKPDHLINAIKTIGKVNESDNAPLYMYM